MNPAHYINWNINRMVFIFYLLLASAALIRVIWQDIFSSHKFLTSHLEWLAYAHWFLNFYKVPSPTPWSFGEIFEGYILTSRVPDLFEGVIFSKGGLPYHFTNGGWYSLQLSCPSLLIILIVPIYDLVIWFCAIYWESL